MFVCFNNGRPNRPDLTIENFLLDAISHCKKRSRVFGSFYKFTSEGFADRLVDMAGEGTGLDLEFELVCGTKDDPNSETKAVEKAIKDLRGHAKVYNKDPENMMNHNKFMVFESIQLENFSEGQRATRAGAIPTGYCSALYLSSANLTMSSYGKHNNSIIVPITQTICRTLWDYYQELKKEYKLVQRLNPFNKKEDRYEKVKSDACKLYLYPRRKRKNPENFDDTLIGVLENLPHAHGPSTRDCTIHIAVPAWYSSRDDLARTVATCAKNGARVRVKSRRDETSSVGTDMSSKVAGILRDAGDNLTLRYQDDGENIHSKYMLIDGPYKDGSGYKDQKLVWMGSPNYSGAAVYDHWEMICKLYDNSRAYEKYLYDFENLPA